jgi:hypothetical protein
MEEKPAVKAEMTPPAQSQLADHSTTIEHEYPKSLIVLLFFIFPPLAWFFLVIDKSYHTWFPKVLLLSGLISLGFLALSYFSVGTQIEQLYKSLGVENKDEVLIQLSFMSSIVVAVLQILFAFLVHQYLKKHTSLNKSLLTIVIILLGIGSIIGFLPLLITLNSLYPALNNLYQGSY